jgi:peptide/nickel transport system permease protein
MAMQESTGHVISIQEEYLHGAGESLYTKAFKRIRRDRLTVAMLAVLLAMMIFAVGAPVIESVKDVSYRRTDLSNTFQRPDFMGKHVLGTDDLGRDQLARLAYGARVSLAIAFFAALLSLTIGVSLGMVTGYYGGIVDDIAIWVITTLNSIPSLFLLIIVVAFLSPNATALILVLGLLGWPSTMRLVRGETLAMREREFIVSARAMGATNIRIMFNHILPNLLSIVIVTLAIDIGSLLLVEAGLSSLGLGVQPPTPTWGNMLSNSQNYFNRGPHLAIIPGIFISVTVLCMYVIGDGIRDAFDPQSTR